MTNKLGYFNTLKAPPLEGGGGEVFYKQLIINYLQPL